MKQDASHTHLVLIPSYNPGPKVYETVQAAREQWNPVWVVVDGSTDGTLEGLRDMASTDNGLHILVMTQNGKGDLPYLLMEELYAAALARRLDYELLLRESLEGLLAMAFGEPSSGEAKVARWFTDALVLPEPPSKRHASGSVKMRLLDIAADQILERGIGAVTNRAVTQTAGVSTSTILYHFADMRSFLTEAIWHSVFREIPDYLDTRSPRDRERPASTWRAWRRCCRDHPRTRGAPASTSSTPA